MEHTIKQQRGYLIMVAVIVITILAFIGLILTRLFTNQAQTSTNLSLSKQSLYIAVSGLDIGKRDITQKAIACDALAATHNAETLFNGQFSLTGTPSTASTTLVGNISANSASITLTSAVGFGPIGMVKINDEYIYYKNLSGNVLSGLSRGKATSIAADHSAGTAVSQSQCYIQSTGAIPTINAATQKSTVSSLVLINRVLSLGGYQPSVSSGGDVSMSGNAYIANPDITLNESDYPGSTLGIIGSGTLNLTGNAGTKVENVSGTSLVASSTRNHIVEDVALNLPTDPSLYESYFGDYTPAEIQATAASQGNYYSPLSDINNINGVMGEVIYINGDISINGNPDVTIGSPTTPVVLYINGSFSATGNFNLTVYGIVYVTGTISLSGNSSINGEGSLAAAGNLNMTGSTNISLALDSGDDVLTTLYSSVIFGAGTTTYTTEDLGIQQVFS